MPTSEESHKFLYDEGEKLRRKVLGDAHVDKSIGQSTSEFMRSAQILATEAGWGTIWTRDGLTYKQRSLLNLGILATMGKLNELGVHVRGALNNGLTELEIQEALLQVMVYTGIPNGLQAFRLADDVIREYKAQKPRIKK